MLEVRARCRVLESGLLRRRRGDTGRRRVSTALIESCLPSPGRPASTCLGERIESEGQAGSELTRSLRSLQLAANSFDFSAFLKGSRLKTSRALPQGMFNVLDKGCCFVPEFSAGVVDWSSWSSLALGIMMHCKPNDSRPPVSRDHERFLHRHRQG